MTKPTDVIYDRMMHVLGIDKHRRTKGQPGPQARLATWLGVKTQTIRDNKSEGKVPKEYFRTFYDQKQIRPEWLRTGQGPMRLVDVDGADVALGYWEGMTPTQRNRWLRVALLIHSDEVFPLLDQLISLLELDERQRRRGVLRLIADPQWDEPPPDAPD